MNPARNPEKNELYLPIKGKLLKVLEESPSIKTFRIGLERDFSFEAGQFIQLTVPGIGEAPFTPSSSPYEKDYIEVTIMGVGRVTGALHSMKEGGIVGVRGPFGKPYPLDFFYGKEVVLVGGGVGFAPLRSLLLALFYQIDKFKKVILRYGAKTPNDIIYKYLIDEWKKTRNFDMQLTVDKADAAWQGNEGVVTTILDNFGLDSDRSIAVVCGPPIMMKFATLKVLELKFKEENVFLSMEKNMSCGLGKCGHCRLGKYFVCKDGPVFPYSAIKEYPDLWG